MFLFLIIMIFATMIFYVSDPDFHVTYVLVNYAGLQ